ncbi:hypothetical protein BJF85_19745 [Saccharomonospora sp. CUA-673]|uniref:VOC family protein n=1 Tax=Saccharomonospora sp. CUA-673 TaxID=1904969 RepID=UPI0009699E56|nr:VOC family protein [Saccharomonospora sp. CUA-673]OLT44708.1 hypothetical protein BJF85_19745 [Saccharomonospora sp. CUA-673]
MAVRDTAWPVGAPCWVDLTCGDLDATRAFYTALLGWDFVDTGEDYGHYSIAMVDRRAVAAIGPTPPGMAAPQSWTTYLATDDVDATAEAITAEGGRLVLEPGDVGEAGRMGVAADPTGAVFGIWQAGRTTGVQITNVPGALAWNECVTRDYTAAKRFYAAVFGLGFDEPSHGPFEYATIRVDGSDLDSSDLGGGSGAGVGGAGSETAEVGGIGALPDDVTAQVPPHWTTYFAVTDVDAAVTHLVDLGGTVHDGPVDSPRGRLAAVADPGGGSFRLIER